MAVVVMKFGGTSVANVERIRNVARHVKREVDAGNKVAVVVSAMAGVTNQLVAWVREASILHDAREYDAVVATGEQVTAGLLAIVLQSMGLQARSWQGWQIPITTDSRARLGPHQRASTASEIRAPLRGGRGRRHHRLPGHRARAPPHRNIGPRRLRYERGRHGRRTQGRCMRHLHRRRRRLHHRPAHRAEGAAAARRSRTRRCWRWPRSAPRCCRRARSSSPWSTACGCACCRASWRPMRWSPCGPDRLEDIGTIVCDEDEIVEQPGRQRHRLRQGRGEGDAHQGRGQAGRRRRASSARSPTPTSTST